MKTAVIAGGSGFLGHRIQQALQEAGWFVRVLGRSSVADLTWDGTTQGPWGEEVRRADAVINLAGASISLPWTPANRELIRRSRVDSTRALGEALRDWSGTWVNASAVGFYGDRGARVLTEADSAGRGFLADVCRDWEAAFHEFPTSGQVRSVVRIGVVLGREGGAFPLLARLAKLGLGSAVGSGQQYMSWIHLQDLAATFRYATESNESVVWNATAPTPVTNAQLMTCLRAYYGRPWVPNVPTPMLSLVSILGGPNPALLLDSTRAVPSHLESRGFPFAFPDVGGAVADLLGARN